MTLFFIVNIDLTITTEKLVELFGTVGEQLVDGIGLCLDLPKSKREEIKVNYQSPTQQRDAYLDLYVSDHPYPSWKTVANALRRVGLPHQADLVERTYIQGMIIALTTVLGIVPTSVCDCIAVMESAFLIVTCFKYGVCCCQC